MGDLLCTVSEEAAVATVVAVNVVEYSISLVNQDAVIFRGTEKVRESEHQVTGICFLLLSCHMRESTWVSVYLYV